MMRKLLIGAIGLLAMFAAAPRASAQTQTVVTATVTDPNGVPYGFGTATATLVPPGGYSPCVVVGGNCQPISGTVGPITMSAAGSFSMNLWPNADIQCGPNTCSTQWAIKIIISPGVLPPIGSGPQSFTVNETISGSSQDLSSSLSAAAPALCPNCSGGSSGGVKSFNARTGVVVPATGDYTLDQIGSPVAPTVFSLASGPLEFTAPGVFTNTQQNENLVVSINSALPSSIFNATQGGNFGTDGIAGAIAIPSSGVTNGFSSAVHGYITNAGASSGCAFGPCSGVGVAADAISTAAGNATWAFNGVVQSTNGDAASLLGMELDINPRNTGDTGQGLLFAGNFAAQPTGIHVIHVQGCFTFTGMPACAGEWSDGIVFDEGSLENSSGLATAIALNPVVAGNSQHSQAIGMTGTTSTGSNVEGLFYQQPGPDGNPMFRIFPVGFGSASSLLSNAFIAGGVAGLASGCSLTNFAGGASGTFESGTTGTCTVTLTMPVQAFTGWSCNAQDLTTTSDAIHQTAFTTTTATISGTTASADRIAYTCVGF